MATARACSYGGLLGRLRTDCTLVDSRRVGMKQSPSSRSAPSATGSGCPPDRDRWKAYLDTDDDVVMYCPECAQREFLD